MTLPPAAGPLIRLALDHWSVSQPLAIALLLAVVLTALYVIEAAWERA